MDSLTPINLFWTGGWDSTFRLLQLVLNEKRGVQPHYLIDPNRKSLGNEISAQRRIKDRLFKDYPQTRELIFPTIFYEIGDLAEDQELREAYTIFRNFRQGKPLDYQYLWLATYCKQQGIMDMEMSEQNFGDEEYPIGRHIFGTFLEPIAGSRQHRLADAYLGTPVETLFRYYCWPIRSYTRRDMEKEAISGGWADYLYMTWFCHYPVNGRYPCGTCHPCEVTIQQGYPHRIPWWRRLYAQSGLEKVRQLGSGIIRKINPGFHTWRR
jgi:hypothetical protein